MLFLLPHNLAVNLLPELADTILVEIAEAWAERRALVTAQHELARVELLQIKALKDEMILRQMI